MSVEKRTQYRGIMKGTAIFGGVQVFQILVSIIRGKFVAMFLGPEGMGIASLFTSTTNTITQFTGFGLQLSSIKEISEANEQGDSARLSRITTIFRRLTTAAGLLAALISLVFSKWLSEFTFGTSDYAWSFVALSVMLFLTAKATAETTLLQGTRHLKQLAKSSIIGALVGLLVGVPLYYYFGTDGIVPAMMALSLSTYLVNRYFSSKIKIEKATVTTREVLVEGRGMLSLGMIMMVSSLIGTITVYIINVFIRWQGSEADVGLYQAATSITNQYVGLVFTAMGVDYFPRLAAISMNNTKVRELVGNQLEIVILLIVPLVLAMLVSAPFLIRILLTSDFLPIIPMLIWLALGLFFKAFSFPLGYISFAKGDKKTFFWLEAIFGNIVTFSLNIIGYTSGGLVGLGVSFVISYVIYAILVSFVVYYKYDFRFPAKTCVFVLSLFGLVILSFLLYATWGYSLVTYLTGGGILIFAVLYCFAQLNKRMQLIELFRNKFVR